RPRPARPAAVDVRDGGDLVPARALPARRPRPEAQAARQPACRRARVDRAAAALGDVRPLGHRRPVHERAPADAASDRLRLRRPPGRRRHHRARLRGVRRLGRGHGADDRGLSLRAGLSLLRPVAEVREPERDARQDRRARAPAPDAGRVMRPWVAPAALVAAAAGALVWWAPWNSPPSAVAEARATFGSRPIVHVIARTGGALDTAAIRTVTGETQWEIWWDPSRRLAHVVSRKRGKVVIDALGLHEAPPPIQTGLGLFVTRYGPDLAAGRMRTPGS